MRDAAVARLDELFVDVPAKLAELEHAQDPEARALAGTWSVKDTYAHLARWNDLNADRAALRATGRTPPTVPDAPVLNAEWLGEDEGVPLGTARERFESSFRRYRDAVRGVPDERWDAEEDASLETQLRHYEDHVRAPLEFEVAPGG